MCFVAHQKNYLKFTFEIKINLFKSTILTPFLFWLYRDFVSQSLSKWIEQILSYKVNIPNVPKTHTQHILPVASKPLGYLRQETPRVEGLGGQQAVYFDIFWLTMFLVEFQ